LAPRKGCRKTIQALPDGSQVHRILMLHEKNQDSIEIHCQLAARSFVIKRIRYGNSFGEMRINLVVGFICLALQR